MASASNSHVDPEYTTANRQQQKKQHSTTSSPSEQRTGTEPTDALRGLRIHGPECVEAHFRDICPYWPWIPGNCAEGSGRDSCHLPGNRMELLFSDYL